LDWSPCGERQQRTLQEKKRFAGSADELPPDLVSDRGVEALGVENQLFAQELLENLSYDFRVVLVLSYYGGKEHCGDFKIP